MALGASVYKANLNLSDTDRHVYLDTKLTLARHPSETEERMMLRLLVWCLHAHDDLIFGKGLSTEDEPDLWQLDPTGDILEWIDVGQPSLERMKKARSRSRRQFVYTSGRGRDQWWPQVAGDCAVLPTLTVRHLDADELAALAALAEKNMTLTVCIADGSVFFTSAEKSLTITPLTEL